SSVALLMTCLAGLSNCGGGAQARPQVFQFDFANGAQAWEAGFSDYPAGQDALFELTSGIQPLPAPLDQTRTAFFISGNNHSDDLFMFLRVQINGLKPNTTYDARFHVEFATNAPQGCPGIGGSAGESVWVKMGAMGTRPQPIETNGQFVMNIDKGNQSLGGKDAAVLGNIANHSTDCLQPVYETKILDSATPLNVKTDTAGSLWVLVGTDSGFEGPTSLFYRQVRVTLA